MFSDDAVQASIFGAFRSSLIGYPKTQFPPPMSYSLLEGHQIDEDRSMKRIKLDDEPSTLLLASSSSFGQNGFSIAAHDSSQTTNTFTFSPVPANSSVLMAVLNDYGMPSKIYRDPYYSIAEDAPERPREYAGLIYHLVGGNGLDTLRHWKSGEPDETDVMDSNPPHIALAVGGWEYASNPPSVKQVKKWLQSEEGRIHISPSSNKRTQSQVRIA